MQKSRRVHFSVYVAYYKVASTASYPSPSLSFILNLTFHPSRLTLHQHFVPLPSHSAPPLLTSPLSLYPLNFTPPSLHCTFTFHPSHFAPSLFNPSHFAFLLFSLSTHFEPSLFTPPALTLHSHFLPLPSHFALSLFPLLTNIAASLFTSPEHSPHLDNTKLCKCE